MTHHKFIELLNLYLDHEISMEDAAALEAEVQRDRRRMAIYRQYCQMQRGCVKLAAAFAADPARQGKANPFARSQHRALSGWMYGAAAVAACAVFGLVMLFRQPELAAGGNLIVADRADQQAMAVHQTTALAPGAYALGELSQARPELHAVYTPTLVGFNAGTARPTAFYATSTGDRFDWMDDVKLAPMESDKLSFRVRPVIAGGERTYRSQRPIEGKIEMTAFQFQR